MFPILYQTEDFILESYSVFFSLTWLVGGIVFYKEFRRRGWELEKLLFITVGCIIGAVLGSYIFNAIFLGWEETPKQIRLLEFSGKTVLGGLTGGFVGVEITKKIIGYPHSTGDAFAVAIPLGHAIGRIGCLLGGCCYGTECHLPWAIKYPIGSIPFLRQLNAGQIVESATKSLPVHPTQVYEIIFNLILFIYIWKKRDSLKVRGSLFRLYLAAYAGFRFFTEFVRGDTTFPIDGFIKPVQWLLLTASIYFGWVYYRNEIKMPIKAN